MEFKRCGWGVCLGLLVLTGCTTTSMKGTPFYSGEYEVREGPAADRVNLWPLLYYRDPALSVLWPIMESSPNHLAVRPVYSMEDRDTDHPVHNVLWPIARFDSANRDYRVFPVFWGDEYFNVFPLYWHDGDPLSGVGYNALFPFWIWNQRKDGHYLSVMWPLYANHQYLNHQGWRLWPLYGTSEKGDRTYRYIAWPFIHSFSNPDRAGHTTLPLYHFQKSDDRTVFASLPYSRSRTHEPGARSWDLAVPLWYRQWEGDTFRWAVLPALSWGAGDGEQSDHWYALGLGRRLKSPERSSHHVIPLYLYNKDAQARALYTLPWWSKTYADGMGWNAFVPLYYRSRTESGSSFYTLPWWSKTYADGSGWQALLPLYFRSHTTDTSAFYSPLWLSEKHANGTAWQAAFPFYFGSSSPEGSVMLTPFYARKKNADGSAAWRCFVPFVYQDESYDAHFITLLGGRWKMGDQHNWLALPLLSGGAKDAESGRTIWLAGLAGQQWRGDERSHYVFPLYYASPEKGSFISLPYAAWRNGERKNRMVPPLLSGWSSEDEASTAVLVAGLAGFRTGSAADYSYLLPLYYASPEKGSFVSLPYAAWRNGERKNRMVLPLLSGWYSAGDVSGSILAAGLAGHRSGDADARHYAFPFYYAAPPKGTFLSLPYASWGSGYHRRQAIPLLLSGRSVRPDSTDNLLLGGLTHWRRAQGGIEASHVLPLYLWSKEDYLYTLVFGDNRKLSYYATPLVGRYNGGDVSGSWAFPLYRHKRTSAEDVKGRYLLLGHYSTHANHSEHGIYGIYDHRHYTQSGTNSEQQEWTRETSSASYLLNLIESRESAKSLVDVASGEKTPIVYSKRQSVFPLWHKKVNENNTAGTRLETSSLLGVLYDRRHEQNAGAENHDYLRRRILWRVYHHETLNGDASTDMFPAITVDSYQNGYYKFSMLWRLIRYENDPETGRKKLDFLFLPLRR